MKKVKKSIVAFIFIFLVTLAYTAVSASAHDLKPWAQHYTPNNANSTYGFSIYSYYTHGWNHVDGSTFYHYWYDNTTKTTFETRFNEAVAMWGGLITAVEKPNATGSHGSIRYFQKSTYSGDAVALINTGGDGTGHIALGNGQSGIETTQGVGSAVLPVLTYVFCFLKNTGEPSHCVRSAASRFFFSSMINLPSGLL
ncbi:MAG: hypothetical protein FWF08_09140 [Oscillospiraceae bacterium]|nr:hypothetical protein [Oscillospiraceae bacterium]